MREGLYLIRKKKKTRVALNIADCFTEKEEERNEQKAKVNGGVGRFVVTSGRIQREIELRFILHIYFG